MVLSQFDSIEHLPLLTFITKVFEIQNIMLENYSSNFDEFKKHEKDDLELQVHEFKTAVIKEQINLKL